MCAVCVSQCLSPACLFTKPVNDEIFVTWRIYTETILRPSTDCVSQCSRISKIWLQILPTSTFCPSSNKIGVVVTAPPSPASSSSFRSSSTSFSRSRTTSVSSEFFSVSSLLLSSCSDTFSSRASFSFVSFSTDTSSSSLAASSWLILSSSSSTLPLLSATPETGKICYNLFYYY